MVDLSLGVTLELAQEAEQHLRSHMVDPFIRLSLMMELVTKQRVKPLILKLSLWVALNLQQFPLPDLSLGGILRMGRVTGPDLMLV